MRRVRFPALLTTAHRAAFAEAFETVLCRGTSQTLAAELVTREGGAVAVTLALAAHGAAPATKGAAVVAFAR